MKVYITGEAPIFGGEKVIEAFDTLKKAQDSFRSKYPHCRKWEGFGEEFSSASDASQNPTLLFIHEREIK